MTVRDRKDLGFSLIELLVVVAIIMILCAVSIPLIASYIKNYRIRAAGQQVVEEIQRARNQGVQKNVRLGVLLVILDNRTYRTVIEDGQTAPVVQTRPSVAALLADPTCAGGGECPQASAIRTLPLGCQFTTAGATANSIRFNNLGAACQPGSNATCPAIDTGLNEFVADTDPNNVGGWMITISQPTNGLTRTVGISLGGRPYSR